MFNKNDKQIITPNCPFTKNKKDIIENLSRRIGMPIYIPLVSLIASFLLIRKKEKKFNFLNRYIFFLIGFLILVVAEMMVRYSGLSQINFTLYFIMPFFLIPLIYFILSKSINSEHKA